MLIQGETLVRDHLPEITEEGTIVSASSMTISFFMFEPSVCYFSFSQVENFLGGACFTPGVVLYYNQKLIFASPFFFFCCFASFMAQPFLDFM